MITEEHEFLEEFQALFFRLYRSSRIETRTVGECKAAISEILDKVAQSLGSETSDALRSAIIIAQEEQGMQLFLEGLRYGMSLVSECL